MEPFLPGSSGKLIRFLNREAIGWERIGDSDLLPAGHQLNQPELLFEKIEDEQIQAQLEKLEKSKKMNEMAETRLPDAKDEISYDDFDKMDIRIARVLEAERVPKTDKLIKLKIDTGIDQRTVVSGIAIDHLYCSLLSLLRMNPLFKGSL